MELGLPGYVQEISLSLRLSVCLSRRRENRIGEGEVGKAVLLLLPFMLNESNSGALDSSSAAESGHTSMGESPPDQSRLPDCPQNKLSLLRRRRRRDFDGVDDEEDGDGSEDARGEEVKGSKIWEAFNDNFWEVQDVLEQNRVLIRQVNDNHLSKIPVNLTKNVALIREINGNVAKVVSLYSHLSAHFSDVFHPGRAASDDDNDNKA